MVHEKVLKPLSRRAFLGGAVILAGGALAACGQAAAPVASAPPSSAAGKPSTAAAGASSATAKPATGASAKPASSSSAASPAASAKPSGQGVAAVKGAWVGLVANQMLWPLAQDAGYFDKYGIKMDLTYIAGSGTAAPALLAGQEDMLQTGGQVVVGAVAAKQDMVMIAGLQNQVVSTIVAVKGIDKVDDVRGKNVAVTKVGNSDYYTWVDLAQKRGWNIEDFKFVAANDQPGQVQMLGSGNAQAISVSPPIEVSAVRAGGHVILDLTKEQIPLQQIGIVLTKSWLAQNRDKALNVLKATIEAEHRWKTDAAFTKGVIKKWLKEDDQAFIDSGYDNFKDVWTMVPYPSREGFLEQVREVSSLNPAVKDVNVDQCMDLTLVKQLEDSGFIKQIYA